MVIAFVSPLHLTVDWFIGPDPGNSWTCNWLVFVVLFITTQMFTVEVMPVQPLLLYKGIIQPILLYCSPCFFTNQQEQTYPNPKHSTQDNTSSHPQPDTAIKRLAPDHPLNRCFTLLPSGRRYRTLDWEKMHISRNVLSPQPSLH